MSYNIEKQRNIYITANIACNLRCVYCYEKDKNDFEQFSIEKAKNTLRQVLMTPSEKGTIISFHGGEPMLSFLKIAELCEWAWEQHFPEKFLFFATTNGTMVHGEIQNWFRKNKHRFILGLSFDGNREMQNVNRSDSFDLIDLDFFVETYPEQSVKMTISPLTLGDLSKGVIFLHEKGFREIAANLAEMVKWNLPFDLEIYRRELQKLCEYYLKNPSIKISSLFNVSFAEVLGEGPKKWCGAGTEIEAHDIDGKKYPCHLFFESVCGKERFNKLSELNFTDPLKYTAEKCLNCPILRICPTCYGSNFIERGELASRDMTLCEFTKVRMAEVAKFYYGKIVEDPNSSINLSEEGKYKQLITLTGIEKVSSFLGLN